jgi:hypothetical protein
VWYVASSRRHEGTCFRCAWWPRTSFTFTLYWAILKAVKYIVSRLVTKF